MKLDRFTYHLTDIQPASLSAPSRDAVISIICRLNNIHLLTQEAEGKPFAYSTDYRELTNRIIAHCLTAADSASDGTAPAYLLSAIKACANLSDYAYTDDYDRILDHVFGYLDNGDMQLDLTGAALIVALLSSCSLPDGGDKDYIDALAKYIDGILPQLEADILPLAALPSPQHEVPTNAHTRTLVRQMNTVSLIMQSDFLLPSGHRLRVLPLYDILRRYVPALLAPHRYGEDAEATLDAATRNCALTNVASLLSAFSRMIYSDLMGGPSSYYTLLATIAGQGLEVSSSGSDAWWQYLDVLAQATDEYENAKFNALHDNPFE